MELRPETEKILQEALFNSFGSMALTHQLLIKLARFFGKFIHGVMSPMQISREIQDCAQAVRLTAIDLNTAYDTEDSLRQLHDILGMRTFDIWRSVLVDMHSDLKRTHSSLVGPLQTDYLHQCAERATETTVQLELIKVKDSRTMEIYPDLEERLPYALGWSVGDDDWDYRTKPVIDFYLSKDIAMPRERFCTVVSDLLHHHDSRYSDDWIHGSMSESEVEDDD